MFALLLLAVADWIGLAIGLPAAICCVQLASTVKGRRRNQSGIHRLAPDTPGKQRGPEAGGR
jgi:hypothetical protein